MRFLTAALLLGWSAPALAQPSDAPAEKAPASAPAAAAAEAGEEEEPAPAKKRDQVDRLDPSMALDDEVKLRIFKQAQRRKEEVARLEAELARRESRLKGLQSDVEARYKALRLLQEELSAAVKAQNEVPPAQREEQQAKEDQAKNDNIRRLSRVFEKMKPDEAAKVVPEMDEDLVVDVLLRIKDRQAAKILGAVEPVLAARLSEKMALLKKAKPKRGAARPKEG